MRKELKDKKIKDMKGNELVVVIADGVFWGVVAIAVVTVAVLIILLFIFGVMSL